jgi:hypothetical protein
MLGQIQLMHGMYYVKLYQISTTLDQATDLQCEWWDDNLFSENNIEHIVL